jgi:nucleoside-diphosphate-sugar epimerase
MKIFLTGGTGFIGSHLIKALSSSHQLICLRRSNLSTVSLDSCHWVNGGYEDDLSEYLRGCDMVVHLAAHSANTPYDSLENCINFNLIQPLKFIHQSLHAGIQRYLIVGSYFEYGLASNNYDKVPVNAPLQPIDSYSASKAMAYLGFQQVAIQNKLSMKYLRLFQVFGDGEEESRLLPSLKRAALAGTNFHIKTPSLIRDFIPVETVVKRIKSEIDLFEVQPGSPVVKNIGTGIGQTIKDFSLNVWSEHKANGVLTFGEEISQNQDVILRAVADI